MATSILVVDDEQDMRDYLSDLLNDNGYTVRTASNGVEAMEMVKAETPALILLDLQMPEETGTGLYRRLHDSKALRHIPVIVISGLAGRHVAVSKSVPIFDKPLDEERVMQEVNRVMQAA